MSDNDNILIRELYFLIFKFLEKSPCNETIRVLREELEKNSLLPPQYNWTNGAECSTSVDQVKSQNSHVTADYLLRILKQSSEAVSQLNPPPVNGIVSLLSSGRFSLLRSIIKKDPLLIDQDESLPRSSYLISNLANHINHAPIIPSTRFYRHHPGNFVSSLISREISGPKPIAHLVPSKFYERYTKYRRLLGHLSSVYCVLFDRTGQYIFTGADDSLVKIWSASNGRLLMTLRGHINEITDLSVNYENTMIAAGSCDKMIRVWCLKTTAPITILNAHNALITSVKFCPLMKDDNRYLVSTSNDGCVCFWEYNAQTNVFKERPIKFTERRRPGAQIVCSSFSVGGVFLAIGSSDNYLRVYHVSAPAGPTKILEIEQHSDHVDSIQFSNHSTRFVSGSRDGIAHIWYFEKQNWRNIALRMTERLPGMTDPPEESRKVRVSMVGWTCDDAHVITSLSDNSIKVWESKTGKLRHVLYGHEEEVFVIEPHPKDGRIFLSGGHDGAIIIWDLITGTTIQTFFNAIDGQGHGAVFDCKFSPDGMMFASTDSHGHLTLFGLCHSDSYSLMPDHVFFHTDYRPVIRDANHYAIDEQTQIAPHLMPPPFLVDIEGNPYPPAIQRLVPGRENCAESQLIPYVADASLMGDAGNAEADAAAAAAQQRQTIDDLIQQLARNVDQNVQQPNNANAALAPAANNQQQQQEARNARDPNRRNGDVEGVRQPANFLSRGNAMRPIWYKKPIVPSLSPSELVCNRDRQIDFAKSEEEYYNSERRKRQDAQELITIKIESQKPRFTRSKQRIIQQRRGVRMTPFIRTLGANGGGINDFENPDEIVTDDDNDKDFSGKESSSESDESDDSDWNTPTTSAGTSRPKRKRTAARSSEDEAAVPAPPTEEEEARKAIRREKLNEIRNIRRRRYEEQYNAIRELPEAFKPSEWLADTKPKRTPYFPQIGDEIVYFRSGHQHYIDHIRSNAIYSMSSSVKPYKLRGCYTDEIFAKIVNVRYDVKPPRLVSLKLAVMDPESEVPLTNIQFTVRYHDVENVVDFIILKQLYDQSIAQDWKQGDEFQSVIDDKWWFGKIDSVRMTEPFSYFQCCEVTWANGDQEFLSPWDLESINEEVLSENRTEGIPVTDEERTHFNLINEDEWPSTGREEERQRLLNGLIRIMEFSHSEDFIVPVDLGVHPIYGMIIPYPMDLSTVKARIENNFYRRVEMIKFDINFIETNAEQYNVPESEIVKKAKIVTSVCRRFIDDDQCFDPLPIYLEVMTHLDEANSNASTSSSLSTNATVESERPLRKSARRARVIVSDSENENHHNRPSRSRQPTSNANSDYLYPGTSRRPAPSRRAADVIQIKSWKQNCRELLDYLFDLQDSEPFRSPVDPIHYPNYSHVIDTPMDLTTVKEQLLADIYDSPNDFCKDMRLVFVNSKTFNTNKKSRIYSMTVRLSSLFEEKMRNIMSNWKSTNKLLKRGTVSRRRRPLPLSPVRGSDDRNSRSSKQPRARAASPPLEHPSTSAGYSNSRNRTSHRNAANVQHYAQSSNSSHDSYHNGNSKRSLSSDGSPVEKYGLRRRNKKARKVYKEESDEEGYQMRNVIDDDTGHSTRSRASGGLYHLRKKRKNSDEFYDEDQLDQLLDAYEHEKVPEEGEETEEDESEDNEDSEETKDEEEEDDDEADPGHANDGGDSDATQIEEDDDGDDDDEDMDKENSNGKRRPTRAAARKLVNYDENDGEESDTEVIREKSVNVRRNGTTTGRHSNRFSFAQINESSRSSMSSNRSHNAYNVADSDGDDGSRPLRRSRRKVRRTRRYSSDEENELPVRSTSSSRTAGSGSNDYDGSDLYSAVKTRHRNAAAAGHGRHRSHHRNYKEEDDDGGANEDDDDGGDDEVYSPNSQCNARRRGVFSNGRTTLMSRS